MLVPCTGVWNFSTVIRFGGFISCAAVTAVREEQSWSGWLSSAITGISKKVISRPGVCQLPLAGTANLIPSGSACWASETCLLRHAVARPLAACGGRSNRRKDEKTQENPAGPAQNLAEGQSGTCMCRSLPVTVPNQQLGPLHQLLWQSRDIGAQRAIHHGAPRR